MSAAQMDLLQLNHGAAELTYAQTTLKIAALNLLVKTGDGTSHRVAKMDTIPWPRMKTVMQVIKVAMNVVLMEVLVIMSSQMITFGLPAEN
jgi:hypothetical protein